MGDNLLFKIVQSSIFLLFLTSLDMNAQVGIGTTDPTAALDVTSTNDGFLVPRVALTGRTSASPLTSPTTSEMVYNTATVADVVPGFYYWDGTKWVPLLFGDSSSWEMSGNSGTTAGTNFIGTTDAVDFVTKTNNTEKMRVTSAGNIGIGTPSPANKLEITQGTAGNSGLRFTNLNSSSTANTAASKVLGLNSTGDVILTNVPGTQNIVDFSTANPNSGSPVFTPNTPSDESVVYQSAVDNSLWTYNGTAYVAYTAPASTAWNLGSTTNDAGNNKTSSIWRSGGLIAGGTSSSRVYGNLTGFGGSGFTGVPPLGTASVGLISNSSAGWTGSGFLFSNSTVGITAFSMVYNTDRAYFGQLTPSNTSAVFGVWSSTGLLLGANANPLNRLDVTGGVAVGTYAGVNTAPSNGLIVSGNVGIGTTTPLTKLVVNDNAYIASLPVSSANLMDNTTFRPLTRFQTTSGANNNAISHYLTTTAAATQAHNYSTGASLPYVLQPGGGNVGIGATAPAARLHIQGIQATLGANANATMLRMSRPTLSGQKWGSVAQFNLGTYVDSGNNVDSKSRLDLALANGNDDTTLTPTPTMTWLANGNVGINNTAPSAPLVVQGVTGTGSLKLIAPSVASGDNWWLGFGHGTTSTDANDRARIGAEIISGGAGRLFFTTGTSGSQTRAMFIDQTQRVGIGTSTPVSRLEVNGSATNTAAFNLGSATAVTFNMSNLAYTTASPGAFNLQGMKDGGTYTLAVQGTTSGTASFSGLNPSNVAFVFKSINNGTTIAGKDTLYTFVVMGTTVYVYMATGF
jgi:hypothetical protein